MTGNEMLDTLALRLEDPTGTAFTAAAKLDALNIAQREVVNIIHNGYLTDLQVIDAHTIHTTNAFQENKLTASTANVTFATAGIAPIRNGIIAIKVYNLADTSGSYTANSLGFANMIEPRDIKRLENSYLAGTDTNPVAYVFQETIFVEIGTDVTSLGSGGTTHGIDIWYLKQPTALVANDTECELNIALHTLVVDLAEHQLWKMDNKADRGALAYNNAISQITALNERYATESPNGIGTTSRYA